MFYFRALPGQFAKNEGKNITVSDHIDSNSLQGLTAAEND